MKLALVGALALGLAACSAQQQAAFQAGFTIACQKDSLFQPVIVGLLAGVPQAAAAAQIDQLLVHPSLVAVCDALLPGSKPTAVASK